MSQADAVNIIENSTKQENSSKENKNKEKKKDRKRQRNIIKAYTTNINSFVTIKGRVRALVIEIVRDNPLITFNELLEKLKARDEFIRKYLEGQVNTSSLRKTFSREITIRKIIDGMAKEGLIFKIQLNDERFLRFVLPSQLELLRQQGVQLV